jgi:ABC-type transport system involved in multi-copper enzyme maturation permease subunit
VTGLIRGELLKIRTTNTWWLFGLGILGFTALALLINCIVANETLDAPPPDVTGLDPEEAAQSQANFAAQSSVIRQAANIYTSGQFFGGLFVLLLGMLLITNEFYHQTATATFLTTPHRSAVVTAKLITAMAFAAFFWLIITGIDVAVGAIFLNSQGYSPSLGEWEVQRAILFNLLVFMLWAILGVGFGALIRNQVGAVVTGAALYLIGTQIAQAVFFLIYEFVIKEDWVLTSMVVVPAVAAQILTSPNELYPEAPEYWVGGIVMLAYGAIAGLVGTLIMRTRDIS